VLLPEGAGSARLDARHELEHVLPLDGLLIRRAEAPVRDALVDLAPSRKGKSVPYITCEIDTI
jgi:hypothetical protein